MRAQVVHDHDGTGPELGQEHVLEIGQKHAPIRGSVDTHRLQGAAQTKRAENAHIVTPVARGAAKGARAAQAAGVKPGHGAVDPALVDEHKVLGPDPGRLRGPGRTERLYPLAAGLIVFARLFLRVWRRRKSIRPTVAALMAKPALRMF